MSIARLAFLLTCLAAPVAAQTTLTVTTPAGTIPRIPPTPFIPGCQTTPNPFYFSIRGTVGQPPLSTQEIRLFVKPTLYNGMNIPGCTWVLQCQRAFVLPDNSFVVIGQFGDNNTPRGWFAGQQADVQFALFDRATTVPTCVTDPATIALAVSNVVTVRIDPLMPTLHDYALPCSGVYMDVQGDPTIGNAISWTLPTPGAIAFAPVNVFGFPLLGCTAWLGFPIVLVSTDAMGNVTLTLPLDPALLGAELATQGALVTGGVLDLTQPTLLSIR
ncbi:MAG: hypothetical protein IPM29_13210 [Planctomycetes bacterium]|nr:hypothetical protein [Planctomycetota bacterium]